MCWLEFAHRFISTFKGRHPVHLNWPHPHPLCNRHDDITYSGCGGGCTELIFSAWADRLSMQHFLNVHAYKILVTEGRRALRLCWGTSWRQYLSQASVEFHYAFRDRLLGIKVCQNWQRGPKNNNHIVFCRVQHMVKVIMHVCRVWKRGGNQFGEKSQIKYEL